MDQIKDYAIEKLEVGGKSKVFAKIISNGGTLTLNVAMDIANGEPAWQATDTTFSSWYAPHSSP